MPRESSSVGTAQEPTTDSPPVSRRAYLAAAGATAAGLSAGCLGGGGDGGTPTINIITWEEFEDLESNIESTLDVELEITTSTSSSEMFSGWNSGQDEQFDIAVPNNNYVPKMMDADLVAPVNKDAVSNWDSLYDKFHEFADNQFVRDSDHHGVPIRFGWYGYAYDTRDVEDHTPSYKILFEEDYVSTDLDGQLIMYDDYFKSISATALYLGFRDQFDGERVTLSQDQIDQVKEAMIDQKPRLQGYIASDPTFIKSFRQGDFLVGHSGRNEVVEMLSEDDSWPQFVAPEEGALAWFESAVVSKKSENKEMAWKVINEFISAENGAALAKAGFSPSCNPNTQEELTDEQNEMFGSIDPSRLDAMIPFKAIDDKEPAWQDAWEEVKAA